MRIKLVEQWVPVLGFEGLYEVSDFGRVRSLTTIREHGGYRPREIKGKILSSGSSRRYKKVTLWDTYGIQTEFRVHVLVAKTFISNPNNLPLVLHRDDNQHNNAVTNLRWGTKKDNWKDAVGNNKIPIRKLTPELATTIKKRLREEAHTLMKRSGGGLDRRLAKEYGLNPSTIGDIRKERIWRNA